MGKFWLKESYLNMNTREEVFCSNSSRSFRAAKGAVIDTGLDIQGIIATLGHVSNFETISTCFHHERAYEHDSAGHEDY